MCWQATAEANNLAAVANAKSQYSKDMEEVRLFSFTPFWLSDHTTKWLCINIKFTNSLLQCPSDPRKIHTNSWFSLQYVCAFFPHCFPWCVSWVFGPPKRCHLWAMFIKKCTSLCYFGPLWWFIHATDLCDLSVLNTILSYLKGVWKGKAVPAPTQHEAGTQVLCVLPCPILQVCGGVQPYFHSDNMGQAGIQALSA